MPTGRNMRTTTEEWTPERVERLKELHAQGLSGGQIHKLISGTTRMSVIGKLARLGLSQTTKPGKTIEHKPQFKKPAAPKAIRANPLEPVSVAINEHMSPSQKKVAIVKAMAAVTPPARLTPHPVRGARQCCYPLGDPRLPDFKFCEDAAETRGMCGVHYRLCYPGNGKVLRERAREQREHFGPKFGAGFVDASFDAG